MEPTCHLKRQRRKERREQGAGREEGRSNGRKGRRPAKASSLRTRSEFIAAEAWCSRSLNQGILAKGRSVVHIENGLLFRSPVTRLQKLFRVPIRQRDKDLRDLSLTPTPPLADTKISQRVGQAGCSVGQLQGVSGFQYVS